MSLREEMDAIYASAAIPWDLREPPAVLLELLDSGVIQPAPAIDLGCGAGNYALALARRGFEVTGVDLSARAVAMAEQRAAEAGVSCRFEARDLLGDVSDLAGRFGFAMDWEVLHHVFPQSREVYADNVRTLLRDRGHYLSVCFSEDSPQFGSGKMRTTPLGTRLYFSSEAELRALFEPRFEILSLRTLEIPGTRGAHLANVALLQKS